jgi:hypothetical protein
VRTPDEVYGQLQESLHVVAVHKRSHDERAFVDSSFMATRRPPSRVARPTASSSNLKSRQLTKTLSAQPVDERGRLLSQNKVTLCRDSTSLQKIAMTVKRIYMCYSQPARRSGARDPRQFAHHRNFDRCQEQRINYRGRGSSLQSWESCSCHPPENTSLTWFWTRGRPSYALPRRRPPDA